MKTTLSTSQLEEIARAQIAGGHSRSHAWYRLQAEGYRISQLRWNRIWREQGGTVQHKARY